MAARPDEELLMMVAEFGCVCGHGWNSIRSLNLPEKCEKCHEKGHSKKYRVANHQEILQGKRLRMLAKYKCDICENKWKSKNSSGGPKACQDCKRKGVTHMVKPYNYEVDKQKLQKQRMFGFFECECKNEWASAYTWDGKYQECRRCNSKVYAHSVQPLRRGDGSVNKGPHQQDLCEKCKELGHSCRSFLPVSGPEEFEDGESILSVGSVSTTDSETQRGGEDVTPTVSDTEDQVDESLDKQLQELAL